MMTQTTVKRLVRELERNKMKSAVLGLLCLVAIWFWAPLVRKFLKSDKLPPTAAAAPTFATTETKVAETSAAPDAPAAFDWRAFIAWKAEDPRMAASTIASANPFLAIANNVHELAVVADAPPQETEDPAVDRTPQDYGLALRSTLVSPRVAMANISGELYELGSEVKPSTEPGEKDIAVFRLVRIAPDHVLLEREGRTYRVDLISAAPNSGTGRVTIQPVSR